jgi:ATP-dependent Clp protease ATP-binding subunit ClpA
MEDTIHERIIGQNMQLFLFQNRSSTSRLKKSNRLIASFILLDQLGLKTELTKVIRLYVWWKEESMIRLDMSEYMEKHTVAKLIGSPPLCWL